MMTDRMNDRDLKLILVSAVISGGLTVILILVVLSVVWDHFFKARGW